MEKATKSAVQTATGIDPHAESHPNAESAAEDASFVAFMDDSSTAPEPQKNTSSKALDRWFAERQSNHAAPRLLEIPNEALVTNGGPLQITGNLTIVGEDGKVRYANHLSLCRCGRSSSKPNCDEAHSDIEFLHSGKFSEISEVSASRRPSKLTISCVKDGPITFRGRLRMHNEFGQECVKMRGSLCRCGQSTNKPFCDGSHSRTGFKTG